MKKGEVKDFLNSIRQFSRIRQFCHWNREKFCKFFVYTRAYLFKRTMMKLLS